MTAPSNDASQSYLDLLYQRPNGGEDDAQMPPLRPGWGLSPDRYPTTGVVMHSAEMVPWLSKQLADLLKDCPAPGVADLTQEKLREWKDVARRVSYAENGVEKLQGVIEVVTKDILEQRPNLPTEVAPSTVDITQGKTRSAPQVLSGGPNWHHRLLHGEGYDWGIRMEDQEGKTSIVTRIFAMSQERAQYYLPQLARLSREHTWFDMDATRSRHDIVHLVQLISCLNGFKGYGPAPYPKSPWEDKIPVPRPALVSVPALTIPHEEWLSTSLDILMKSPTVKWSISIPRIRLIMGQILLAFLPRSSSSAQEHYTLCRTEDGKDGVFPFEKIDDAVACQSSSRPILSAFSVIGQGTCGWVYLAEYGHHRFAAKVSPTSQGQEHCLVQEYETYMHMRRFGLEGKVVPRCFGLYKGDQMTVLLTSYSGYALKNFDDLCIEDRLSIFRAAKALEDAGINQGSFSPRNVVCDDNNIYRIIDFHRGTYVPGRKADFKQMRLRGYFHLEEEDV
ncbi:hypothetical protein CALCODRAFT_507029 [Calocera cornea HHB12733]|uniref:Protein kinase domain-containing protein n=1 Tax=Calocera cornea HHB12733 TaxID=1353952 RepID=A0A165I6N0_9BASI|nr:hypothetical protein CALCODRAFT_507029 [Calocera cornea HHB12733]